MNIFSKGPLHKDSSIAANTPIWTEALNETKREFDRDRYLINLKGKGTVTAGTKIVGPGDKSPPGIVSAETFTITSLNGNDVPAGTGARKITFIGVDANWQISGELLDPKVGVGQNTLFTYLYPLDVFVSEAGSNGINIGNITVANASDSVRADLDSGLGKSKPGFFPVPAGYTAVIRKYGYTNAGAEDFFLRVTDENGLRKVPLDGNGFALAPPQEYFIRVAEKSLIEWVVESAAGGEYEYDLEVELIKNP